MSRLVYIGNGKRHPASKPSDFRSYTRYRQPENYIAEPGLVNAVNVALLLDRPLLLTGEPGTGKTQLAYSLAWELELGETLKFETKSTSTARDLFYSFDAVGRFKSVDTSDALSFLTWNALGMAILFSNEEAKVSTYLKPGIRHAGKRRSVVLIDEVDKAPRDFPNDILNEIEFLRFSVPELGPQFGNEEICADLEYRPIVVITSNSEKDLPDAFLRRCIYYNLPFPNRDTLQNIVAGRLGEFSGSSSMLLSSALELFFKLRDQSSQLRKRPATAELLDWLLVLRTSQNGNQAALTVELAKKTLSSLIKTAEDQDKAEKVIEKCCKSSK